MGRSNEVMLLLWALYSENAFAASPPPIISDSTLVKAKMLLIADESVRLKPYIDTAGQITLGVGRNLSETGITQAEAMMLFENDIARVTQECERNFPFFKQLNEARQVVMINMVFNMGINGVLGFKQMIGAMGAGNFVQASRDMLASLWSRQLKKRSQKLASIMASGKF